MRFLSDLLKPVAALPVVLGVLVIAGWRAYAFERSATTSGALAQADAIAQSLEELESEDKPVQVQEMGEPEISDQNKATN